MSLRQSTSPLPSSLSAEKTSRRKSIFLRIFSNPPRSVSLGPQNESLLKKRRDSPPVRKPVPRNYGPRLSAGSETIRPRSQEPLQHFATDDRQPTLPFLSSTSTISANSVHTFLEPPTPQEAQPQFPERIASQDIARTQKLKKEPDFLRPRPTTITPGQSPVTSPELRGRQRTESGSNLVPPPTYADLGHDSPRSLPSSRPGSPYYHSDGGSSADGKLTKRKSWMPGSRSRAASKAAANAPKAWFLGMDGGGHPYDASPMLKGDKVPELWDEQGDVFVYLHPQSENRGPSFRIPTRAIADSDNLMTLAFGSASGLRATRSFDGRGSSKDASRTLNTYGELSPLSPPLTLSDGSDSMRSFAPREGHLYFPSRTAQPKEDRAAEDEEYYVSVRNVFAFLTKQTLVATKRHPTTFSVFILISGHLSRQGFLSLDGATFGDVATTSFNFYTEAFQLADVRRSREKTMEGIILGECMRSMELYNESFAHGVGKYDEIIALKSTLFGMISPASRSRIERAWIDLGQRKQAVSLRLETFEFPALFSGVAASTSSDESKLVRFKAWKSHFLTMRRQVLGYYKDLYGAWPPRASSKKNNLTYDGLNRLVLRNLYLDLCTLYDLLVDRSSLTSRSTGASITTHTPVQEALRKLLHESDHSSPPVQPPTPFDVPLLPSISTLEPNLDMLPQKQQNAASTRKLKDYEIKLILARSHNLDSQLNTPFLRTYMDFEQREAKGKNASELAELRIGCWLFVYVVIQSLPMLVVDAPNLKYTQGVETFLCQPPKGLAPWMDESTQVKRNWYGVNGGAGMVSLPSDVVEYGVEGIYRASHCWTVADQWMKGLEFHDPEVEEYALSPTTPGENQGYSDLEWNARPREPSRSRDCLTADFAHMSFSQPDMYETQHEIYSQPGQHEMHSSSRHASDIFPRAYTPPQQYQYQPPYIGMPGGTTPPSRPMHQSTTMPDLRIYTTSQPPHRYASPPEQSRSQASNDWQHRHRSGTVEGYGRVARSTEPVKEVKGFDDILADMQREKNGAKKEKEKDKVDSGNQERRKSWLGF